MTQPQERLVLDKQGIRRALKKMASEVVSENPDLDTLAFVGIRTRGVPLAERLAKNVDESEGSDVPVGMLDITLYRDDVGIAYPNPVIKPTRLPFELTGMTIILVDDVLNTGRTVRAALDALMDFGRPEAIRLAVLVDRGLRELPIRADYVGKTLETTREDDVLVQLEEVEASDRVIVTKIRKPAGEVHDG
ncbi:MAG: bifunctional pyr operon transcriptional regulator/uracil phosphoribosyltransferase PyrR [Deltaproteobacteria bacterium]|nr:bifunctional pyr operon transcriptional regulator/uracil phosphoribosyltransferase PyrR [Deltaproteobacteria bacterium]